MFHFYGKWDEGALSVSYRQFWNGNRDSGEKWGLIVFFLLKILFITLFLLNFV